MLENQFFRNTTHLENLEKSGSCKMVWKNEKRHWKLEKRWI